VHGFYNKSADEMKTMVYGEDRGSGGLLQDIRQLELRARAAITRKGEGKKSIYETGYYAAFRPNGDAGADRRD
jgi:hypothetical protein